MIVSSCAPKVNPADRESAEYRPGLHDGLVHAIDLLHHGFDLRDLETWERWVRRWRRGALPQEPWR